MNIRPRDTVVAVEPLFPPDMVGHLYVPEQAKDRCKQGIVKYVGDKVTYVKKGDYVIFGAYTGSLIKIDNELLIFMDQDFIEAVVDNIPSIDIPGLYLRDKEGYFQASYGMVIGMLARALQDNPLAKIQNKRPDSDYYDHKR